MPPFKFAVIAAIFTLSVFPARSYAVTNAVVGSCLSGTRYTTIQAVVNAASAGSTVQVCPGSYQEQVVELELWALQPVRRA